MRREDCCGITVDYFLQLFYDDDLIAPIGLLNYVIVMLEQALFVDTFANYDLTNSFRRDGIAEGDKYQYYHLPEHRENLEAWLPEQAKRKKMVIDLAARQKRLVQMIQVHLPKDLALLVAEYHSHIPSFLKATLLLVQDG